MQERRGYGFAWSQPLWIPQIGERPAHLRTRFFGIFSDPNDLAQVLVAAMPLAFAMPRRMNVFSWLFSAGCSYFLFAAYQTTHFRSGTVALVATAMVMITMWLPARWMPYLIGVGLVVFLGLCGTAGGAYFLSRTFIYPFFFLMAVLNAVPRISEPHLPEDHAPVVEPRKDAMWYGTVLTLASVVYIYLSIVLLNKSYGGG